MDPEEYLLSYFVFNRISEKIKNFIKEYDEFAEKKQKESELERAFLPHANTQLTAMFGKVLDYKYPNRYNARSIYEFLESNPVIFDKIYEKLVKILRINIEQKKLMEGETFNPRNYLVDDKTFKIIEVNLDLQKEAILPIIENFPI